MSATSEKIENITLRDFPWGMMVEVLTKFTFRQVIFFGGSIEPVILPKILGSGLKNEKFIQANDLILLNRKNPTMFTNPKFLRCIPATTNIENTDGIPWDKLEYILRKVVLNFRSNITVVGYHYPSISPLRRMMEQENRQANSVTVFKKHTGNGFPDLVRHVDKNGKWIQVDFWSAVAPNPIRFDVYTNDVAFFKNFVNDCKEEEEEWGEVKPFLRRLKVLSGLNQNRFEFRNKFIIHGPSRHFAPGNIAQNGDQFSLLEQ